MLGFGALSEFPIGDATADAVAIATAVAIGAVTLQVDATASASHGVRGTGDVELGVETVGGAAHGIAGDGASTLTLTADATTTHARYELRGEVRQAGVLVNRRVRVYLRDSGAMLGEVDTTVGRFSMHAGFAPAEHYIVPIHLDDAAVDWTPPVANRVLSVLAQDV